MKAAAADAAGHSMGAHVSLSPRTRRLLRRLLLVLILTVPCLALATPPASAPARGSRKQRDAVYAGYSGREWDDDYGVRSGSCHRAGITAALGAAPGAVPGTGRAESRAVASVVGAVIGAAIGAETARRLDATDRSCVGQALELTGPGQSVSWTNPTTQVTYLLTPLREESRAGGCRRFRLIAHGSFGLSEGRTVACPNAAGLWDLAPELQASRH